MQVEWDGSIDTHHAEAAEAAGLHSLDPNDYEVRVQASNVSHVWEGVVGNSGPAEGTNVMHSLNWVSNIHTAGNVGLLSTNYNEARRHSTRAAPRGSLHGGRSTRAAPRGGSQIFLILTCAQY